MLRARALAGDPDAIKVFVDEATKDQFQSGFETGVAIRKDLNEGAPKAVGTVAANVLVGVVAKKFISAAAVEGGAATETQVIGNVASVTKRPGQLGREGEAAASAITGVGKNTQKFTVNGKTRIPDQVNASNISTRNPLHVTEVKNVKSQSFTRQLRDNVDLVGPGGRVDVFVKPNTKLSGPLRRANADPTNPINIRPEL